MATFLDRVRAANDYETDGGYIDRFRICSAFQLWAAGGLSTSDFKSCFSLTTGQASQLDDILATRPAAPLLLINVAPYLQWTDKMCGIMHFASLYEPGFDTDGDVQTALGI